MSQFICFSAWSIAELREQIALLKAAYMKLQADINHPTFESVIVPEKEMQVHAALEEA